MCKLNKGAGYEVKSLPHLIWFRMELRKPGTLTPKKINKGGITNIESCVVFTGKIVKVGDAQRLNGRFSNSTKKVPQENINPHGGAAVDFTFLKGEQTIPLKLDYHQS